MRGNNQSHRGKSRLEVVYRNLGHRDIRSPGDKVFMHFGVVKSETLIRREVPLWEPTVSIAENRGSRDREP
jgi:hypothetical protein